jgi:hypothetical protein
MTKLVLPTFFSQLLGSLLAYRMPVLLATVAASFAGLARGLAASTVLFENSWPQPLRGQSLILAGVSGFLALLLLGLVRRRELRPLPLLALAAAGALTVAFGFAGTAGAFVVVACCFVIGHAVLEALGAALGDATTARERLTAVDTTVVGLAVAMLWLTLLGALQVHMVLWLWAIPFFAAAYAVAAPQFRQRCADDWRRFRARNQGGLGGPRTQSWLAALPLALGIFSVLFYAAHAALPERYFDALTFHLVVPSQVLTFGRWNLDPAQYAFAFMPATVDYIYTFAVLLGGEMAAKLFNLLVLFAILAQISAIARPLYGRAVSGLAVLLYLSIPVALSVTASLYIENTVALLAITAVRLLLQQNTACVQPALIGLVITLGGLSSAKLHGVLLAGLISVLALFGQDYRRLDRRALRMLAGLAAVCIVLGLMPYLLAWVKTGNPVFPLKNALFKSPYWPPVDFEDGRWVGHLSPLLLYRMTFMSTGYLEAWPGAMGFAFVTLLLPGSIAAMFRPVALWRREITVCAAVAGIFGIIVSLQIQYIRYLYPVFPLMVVIAVAAVARLAAVKAWRRPVYAATVLVAALGIFKLPAAGWVFQYTDLSAVFDPNKKTALVRAQVPVRLANEAINAMADNPRVMYATQTAYGAFLAGVPIYVAWYNSTFMTTLGAATTPEAVKMAVEQQRIDFIIADTATVVPHHVKILNYAKANADLVAMIGSLSVFRARR